MNFYKLIGILILLTGSSLCALSKNISGIVCSLEDSSPIRGAYITIFTGDSISLMKQSDSNGQFLFEVSDNLPTTVAITALGFLDKEVTFIPDTVNLPLKIFLSEASLSKDLDEFEVTADKSQVVKRTANGQIFFLSKQAKKEHNPFVALSEIPLLISDFSTSSVKLLDGKQPLILIDGNQINSGIAPILPEEIESVEVITSVPARYLQEGYSGIVNIRLKKKRSPYIWFGLSGSEAFPAHTSGPAVNFEIGNEKFSIYGAGLYSYTRNALTLSNVDRSNTGYRQMFTSELRRSSDQWLGWLLLKYLPTQKDYFAMSLRYTNSKSTTTSAAEGEYVAESAQSYLSDGDDKEKGNIFSGSLYYKHSFGDYNDLELTGVFNTNVNKLNSSNRETIGSNMQDYLLIFHNERNSASLKADYSKTFPNSTSMAFGNHLSMNSDRIDRQQPKQPLFRHRKLDEYLYGALGGVVGKLYYNVSVGLEAIWLKAGSVDNSYLRPHANLSTTWTFNSRNSMQLTYTLTNEAPPISLLNPYNTSTDPLVVSSGNPLLKPSSQHKVSLNYTFNRRGWYVSPQISYYNIRDLVSPWGYTKNDIYYSTYHNSGRYSDMNYFLNLSYNAPWCSISTMNGWTECYYQDRSAKGYFLSYLSMFFRIKKIYIIADMLYTSKSYTENSTTCNYHPTQSRLHVSYNFTPDFYVAVGVENFTGTVRSVTDMWQGSYHNVTETFDKAEGRGFRPYIRLYYNFRKNNKRKIKFNNPNFEEEKGISLKK